MEERNSPVVARIRELKAGHPFWSYRRIWIHLKYVDGLAVNRKRVFRLMQKHELVVKADTQFVCRIGANRGRHARVSGGASI